MAIAEINDDQLVRRARDDPEALGRLYDRHSPGVFRYCIHRLFVRQVAEDVTSEVFLHVARQIRGFTGRTEDDFRNWLYAIATNRVNSCIRSTRRRRALLEAAVRERRIRLAATAGRPGSPEWADLYAAIATLTTRDQAIVTLRGLEGLPFERIATLLSMKGGAVRMAYGRALQALRRRLASSSDAQEHEP